MSGGFFFFLCVLHHFSVVCACVSKLYNGAERDGERKGESGKGQQRKYREQRKESATTGINYRRDVPTRNPLWVVKSRVGKERSRRPQGNSENLLHSESNGHKDVLPKVSASLVSRFSYCMYELGFYWNTRCMM